MLATETPAAPDGADGSEPALPARTRGQRRVTVELWIILAVLVAGASLRWVDSPVPQQLPALQALGTALVPPVVVAIGAALSRRWRLTAAASILALVQIAHVAPSWAPGDRAVDSASGDPLVVMASNLRYGRGDVGSVVAAAEELDVDVLVFLEATASALSSARATGVDERLPHAVTRPREDAGGVLLFSRYPLEASGAPPVPPMLFETPAVQVASPQGDVVVLAAHPVPPWPGHTALWHAELSALASWAGTVPEDVPLIMAGDFNATKAHPVFRRFADAGLRDAHREVGAGPVATWPRMSLPLSISPPAWFHIDHVLARGLDVADAGVIRIPGSDHDAVWAELTPPG